MAPHLILYKIVMTNIKQILNSQKTPHIKRPYVNNDVSILINVLLPTDNYM